MSDASGISLRQFQHIAKQDLEGDVRVSQDQDRLVNKGTLGQKIATLFSDVGRALGLGGGDSRAQRQQQALEGFQKSLISTYGQDIGDQVLQEAGLDVGDVRLTGAKVLEVIDRAQELRSLQISTGREMAMKEEHYGDII